MIENIYNIISESSNLTTACFCPTKEAFSIQINDFTDQTEASYSTNIDSSNMIKTCFCPTTVMDIVSSTYTSSISVSISSNPFITNGETVTTRNNDITSESSSSQIKTSSSSIQSPMPPFSNMTTSNLNQLLVSNQKSVSGLKGCLLNCSNRGKCSQDPVSRQVYCVCYEPFFIGDSCQIDTRPCSSSPCLNGGLCSDLIGSFSCKCSNSFFGLYCEKMKDLCQNVSCVTGHGQCREFCQVVL